jgi:hypothetical protein
MAPPSTRSRYGGAGQEQGIAWLPQAESVDGKRTGQPSIDDVTFPQSQDLILDSADRLYPPCRSSKPSVNRALRPAAQAKLIDDVTAAVLRAAQAPDDAYLPSITWPTSTAPSEAIRTGEGVPADRQFNGPRDQQVAELIEPEFAGTENGHLEHLKRGGRITLEEESDREGFRRPRQFHQGAGIPRQLDCFPEPHRPLAFEEILLAELENGT